MIEAAADLVQLIDVRPLVAYERNARTHSAAQIEQLKDAFRRFGFIGAIAYVPPDGLKIGHGRRVAAMEMWESGEDVLGPGRRTFLPRWHLPAIDVSGLDEDELRALVIADNKLALNAGWDEDLLLDELRALDTLGFDMPVMGFDAAELEAMFNPPAGGGAGQSGAGSMVAEFLIPPFSVLNAREGWWQERKRQWIDIGIKSELGRGENLLKMSDTMLEPDPEKRAAMIAARARSNGDLSDDRAASGQPRSLNFNTQDWVKGKIAEGDIDGGMASGQTGTSIFDPVLCELVYRWFSPLGGTVLDPFAGGSVRGIVAAALGRRYVGVDLRAEQIEANRTQWPAIEGRLPPIIDDARPQPDWRVGDSAAIIPQLDVEADLIFSCPPYGDLEVYSDDPADISTLDAEAFDRAYAEIIAAAIERLRPDRFACFVVGDYRDKRGLYRNFVSKTIAAFEAAGARLYNEAILVTSVGSLPIRAAKQFRTTRKLGKTHQNVLVFVKGDPRKAADALGPVDVSAALAAIEPEDEEAPEAAAAPLPPATASTVKISAAMARLQFIQCGPDCIAAGCHGNCCDAPSRPTGCMITINPDEQGRIEALGGVVKAGLLQPRPGERGCPFKTDGLCDLHASGEKPWGCVASPFTLNPNGTLIVRNRYRLLPCYRGEGPKEPAYRAFRSSLEIIFGAEETARIVDHLDSGGGDMMANIDPAIRAKLLENDQIKKAAKGGEV